MFELVDRLSHLFFTIIGWIMRLAPLGALGAMAYIVGQYGIASLGSYGKLIAACYLAAVLFILILAAIVRYFAGVNLWKFVKYIKDELFLALGTASTEVVLPRIMVKLTNAGCSRTTTGLVVPTGYSFNLDGATLYLSICMLFLAQALGVDLTLGEQITAVLVLMLTSKGMAGVPGSSFLALSATVAAIGHGAIPVAAVALLLGADRIMDSMRVSVNLLGNCVATFVVANWEGSSTRSACAECLTEKTFRRSRKLIRSRGKRFRHPKPRAPCPVEEMVTTGCTSESVLKVRGDVLHRNTQTSTPERKYLQGWRACRLRTGEFTDIPSALG
ncbi:hypothetical protein GCM10020255_064200 [Rhodococcus baikonurensis]